MKAAIKRQKTKLLINLKYISNISPSLVHRLAKVSVRLLGLKLCATVEVCVPPGLNVTQPGLKNL